MISVAIVEDIEEIRIPIKDFLSIQDEFLCETAVESVEDFFKQYNTEIPPEVLLLDIGLPGISGLSAIKLIKKNYQILKLLCSRFMKNTIKYLEL